MAQRVRRAVGHGFRYLWLSVRGLVIVIVGLTVLVFGIVLVPLPGPGWAIVFAGLGILATQFPILRRFMDWLRTQLSDVPPLMLGLAVASAGGAVLLVPATWPGKTAAGYTSIGFGLVIALFQLPALRPTARRIYARLRPDAPHEEPGFAGAMDAPPRSRTRGSDSGEDPSR